MCQYCEKGEDFFASSKDKVATITTDTSGKPVIAFETYTKEGYYEGGGQFNIRHCPSCGRKLVTDSPAQ